jgi:hypothetical protein
MMEKDHRKKLNEIMGQIECSKMFECTTSGFKNLCEAKDYILDDYAICLETIPESCEFAFSLGFKYYCKCPMRVYLVKDLGM